jgi:hypothetical protein
MHRRLTDVVDPPRVVDDKSPLHELRVVQPPWQVSMSVNRLLSGIGNMEALGEL